MPNAPKTHRPHTRVWRDDDRPSAAKRGYDRKWQKIRKLVLSRSPLCVDPHGLHREPVVATEVDHIKPLSKGGTHARDNLQPLCKRCHSKKTVTEDGGLGR